MKKIYKLTLVDGSTVLGFKLGSNSVDKANDYFNKNKTFDINPMFSNVLDDDMIYAAGEKSKNYVFVKELDGLNAIKELNKLRNSLSRSKTR